MYIPQYLLYWYILFIIHTHTHTLFLLIKKKCLCDKKIGPNGKEWCLERLENKQKKYLMDRTKERLTKGLYGKWKRKYED